MPGKFLLTLPDLPDFSLIADFRWSTGWGKFSVFNLLVSFFLSNSGVQN